MDERVFEVVMDDDTVFKFRTMIDISGVDTATLIHSMVIDIFKT